MPGFIRCAPLGLFAKPTPGRSLCGKPARTSPNPILPPVPQLPREMEDRVDEARAAVSEVLSEIALAERAALMAPPAAAASSDGDGDGDGGEGEGEGAGEEGRGQVRGRVRFFDMRACLLPWGGLRARVDG